MVYVKKKEKMRRQHKKKRLLPTLSLEKEKEIINLLYEQGKSSQNILQFLQSMKPLKQNEDGTGLIDSTPGTSV